MSNKDTFSRKEQEILEQLEILRKERELLAELSKIRNERDLNEDSGKSSTNGKASKSSSLNTTGVGVKKGSMSWGVYLKTIINKLGKTKSTDIKDYIRKANPNEYTEETIERTVTNTLWALKKEKEISIVDSVSRKEGYEYYLTDEQKKAANL